MNPKVCVFVDGENFRHSIIELFVTFKKEDYLPKLANWTGFFDWLVTQVAPDGERIRTYWHVIQSIEFWPYEFPNVATEPDQLYRLLRSYPPYKEELASCQTAAPGRLEWRKSCRNCNGAETR